MIINIRCFIAFSLALLLTACAGSTLGKAEIRKNDDKSFSIFSKGETFEEAEKKWYEGADKACAGRSYKINNDTGKPIISKQGGGKIQEQAAYVPGLPVPIIVPERKVKVTYNGFERIFCN